MNWKWDFSPSIGNNLARLKKSCYLKQSGIVKAKYILPRDSSEKQSVLKVLRRIGGHYNEEAQTITFERATWGETGLGDIF